MAIEADQALTKQVFDFLYKKGADEIGVAPVERFQEVPQDRHPRNILSSCRNVLVFGIRQIDSVIDGLPSSRYAFTQQYLVITRKLDDIAMSVSRFFEKKGYSSIQIPSEGFYHKKALLAHLSHVEAAVFAGIGEMGLNHLLLTRRFGPRLQLVSVVTDAPLEASPKAETGLCRQWQSICNKACTHLCPAGCITDQGLDKTACKDYQNEVLTVGMNVYIPSVLCGLCIKGCPKQ